MNYTEIEMEGMKEILKENELEIGRLRKEIKKLKEENNELKEKIKNMEKAEKDFIDIMKKYILNKGAIIKLETLYDICFEGK